MTTAKVKGWILEKGKRILKVLQFGAKTVSVAAPFGDDSNPLKDMVAIVSETSVSGESYVIGYINKNQIAESGEKRIFSLKEDGTLSNYIHLKNDESIEIGGNTDNAVRFSKLKEGIDQKDLLISQELAEIAIAIGSVGGSYTPGQISTDISAAKTEKIKLS